MIRTARATDSDAIAAIYNHFIRETTVTFEEEPVTSAEMASRIEEILGLDLPWLVATDGERVLGFAYASKWKGRCAYRHSVEVTVYLDPTCTGRGLGTKLYEELFDCLRGLGMHAAIGGIALPNDASIALHEKMGMEKVAHFRQVGHKFGKWVDVAYWQKML